MIYGYLRVSTDKQDYNAQRQGVDAFAASKGWHIEGGETPDADMVEAVKDYSEELATHEDPPEWCKQMMRERYNITLH